LIKNEKAIEEEEGEDKGEKTDIKLKSLKNTKIEEEISATLPRN